jgi:epoxyqueuosine reductase
MCPTEYLPCTMPPPTSDEIVRKARELGFAAAGVAKAEPAATLDRFDAWTASGCAAEMDYLARRRDLRADPRLFAPGTRSIIAVAARYPRHPEPGSGFSSFSWGKDYHDVLRERLRRMADWIGRMVQLRTARIAVDSAPLFEREWAVRAGIGWRGRQGQIVNNEVGCCLVLGFLLVDMELTPTPPAANRCGTCRRCLDVCPTGAPRPDGTVDARRCISYWTIEHRGPIPTEVAPLLGQSLFGCDRCTAVCPWNRLGEDCVLPEFSVTAPLPDSHACIAITDVEFMRRFTGTAVQRIGPDGLRRNAAVVVANEEQWSINARQ